MEDQSERRDRSLGDCKQRTCSWGFAIFLRLTQRQFTSHDLGAGEEGDGKESNGKCVCWWRGDAGRALRGGNGT
jgi:hypothetical protein